jgi:hypothetical protein
MDPLIIEIYRTKIMKLQTFFDSQKKEIETKNEKIDAGK